MAKINSKIKAQNQKVKKKKKNGKNLRSVLEISKSEQNQQKPLHFDLLRQVRFITMIDDG